MVRNEFFEDLHAGRTEVKNVRSFETTWKKVVAFEEKSGLCLDNGLSRDEYVALFNAMSIVRYNTFQNYRSFIKQYVRYLIDKGVLPAEQEEIVQSINVDDLDKKSESDRVTIYKDIASLSEAIKRTIDNSSAYDVTMYDLPAAILYLSWYGLRPEQISEYTKSNVLDDGLIVDGNKVLVPYSVLEIFKRLRDSDGFYKQGRGVIFSQYALSDYLIRSAHSDKLTAQNLRLAVIRFNKVSNGCYSLTCESIYIWGACSRAFNLEHSWGTLDLKDSAVLQKIFGKDISPDALNSWKKDYLRYKRLFSTDATR